MSEEEKQRQQSPAGPAPDSPNWFETIEIPNVLKEKVAGAGMNTDLLQQAENAVAGLHDDYEDRLEKEIGQFEADFEAMRKSDLFDTKRLFAMAHELRGEAGSYGYPLISRSADALCKLLEKRAVLSSADVGIVDAHVRAFRTVLKRRIKGEGGTAGKRLVDRLEAIVAEALG